MKRVSRVSMAVLALIVLGACHGNENAVTGAYGSSVVTGEVVMADGVSAEGVDVSVRGTGMSVRLGPDGKFAFAGVPDDSELVFQRASDGISASLRLGRGDGHVVVDLAQTNAKKGRRRAAGSKVVEYEGILQSASATQIVIDAARQGITTIALTPETVIRKGDTVLTAADLLAGMRVHVKAMKVNDVLTAMLVIVQNDGGEDDGDDDKPAVREYEGTVVRASATELVIFDSKRKEETFVIDAFTDIRKGNTPVLAADIQPGWRVHVKATTAADGTTKTALRVIVQNNR